MKMITTNRDRRIPSKPNETDRYGYTLILGTSLKGISLVRTPKGMWEVFQNSCGKDEKRLFGPTRDEKAARQKYAELSGKAIETSVNLRKYLEEGGEYIKQNDPVQASEKLYKAAEEAVKVLAQIYAPDIYEKAQNKGRWSVTLLDKAVEEMAKREKEIRHYWDTAFKLHVDGFHEMRLDISSVETRMAEVEALVELAENERRF
jgi:hypothetical protein